MDSYSTPTLVALIGETFPDAPYRKVLALAESVVRVFGEGPVPDTSAWYFLDGLDYDVASKKITAIKDLRAAIRFHGIEGDDSLVWCKNAVEDYIESAREQRSF